MTLTVHDIIALKFGGAQKFADAIGITAVHARTMKQRGSFPSRHWRRITEAAERLGIEGVDYDALALANEISPKPQIRLRRERAEPSAAASAQERAA